MANRVPLILNTSSNQIQELPTGDNLDLSNSGIHNAGVITATTFNGSFSGTFSGDGSNLTNLSLAQAAVGYASSSGISTVAQGLTGNPDISVGNINASGISTFAGNINANGNIVGDNSTNITGIAGVTASTLTGTLQTAAQPNITSLGTLSSLSVTGNVSVGGTLTYEDVTNVDAVGLITARSGIKVLAGGINAVGVVTATSFTGSIAASNIDSGTVATARLGSGTANSSSFLRGDQTWAAVTSTTINNNADNRIITGSGTANTLEAEANLTFDGSRLYLPDEKSIEFGDDYDLGIGHTSFNGYIHNKTNSLTISSQDHVKIKVRNLTSNNPVNGGDNAIICLQGGSVELYGANAKKLETTSSGVTVTGTVAATAFTGDGSALTGISAGPSTGQQYVHLKNSSGVLNNSGENVYAGYRAGASLASGGAENTFYGTDAGRYTATHDWNTYIGHRTGENSTVSSNTAVGAEALRNNTSSDGSNTAVGVLALTVNDSGHSNAAVGHYALSKQTSASYNTALGNKAGLRITTSSSNVAIGHMTLSGDGDSYNVTGGSNVVIGHMSGYGINSGEKNVFIGYEAAYDTTSGSNNTGVGYQALENLQTGSNNTSLGMDSAENLQTGSNNTCLGYAAQASSSSASNEVTIGNSSVTKFRVPGIKFEAENDEYHFSCDHNLASWVQRFDGVWGNWAPNFNFKATGASPSGTTLGQWGNHQNGHALTFVKSRNNGNSGTSCQAGDDLGSIFWSPFNSANPGCSAAVKVMADSGTWSSTSNPAYMQIMTTPDGSKEPTERIRIAAHGGVIFKGGPLQEKVKITAGKLSTYPNIDLADGNVHYFTTQEATTSTPNLRVNSTIMLNSVMEVGETVAVTIITTAAAAGYSAALQIHGNNQTVNWVGGSAPSSGGSSGVDIYNYTIIKTGSSAFTVIGNLTKTS